MLLNLGFMQLDVKLTIKRLRFYKIISNYYGDIIGVTVDEHSALSSESLEEISYSEYHQLYQELIK